MDQGSQWYIEKRSHLLIFWVIGSLLLAAIAFSLNWRIGAGWTVFAILGFIVIEKLMLRTVDPARTDRGVCGRRTW
jgi:hypothetical protein